MLRSLRPRCFTLSLRLQSLTSTPSRLNTRLIYSDATDIEHQLMQAEERRQEMAERKASKQQMKKKKGFSSDNPMVRTSKTMSYILRHGAKDQGLQMRGDGFVRVDDLLALQVLHDLDFETLQRIVENDLKKRYTLISEPDESVHGAPDVWWIRANQGHSIKAVVDLELQVIKRVDDIPTKLAVHGTTRKAWEIIRTEGLSKMRRNHIHLAQGVPGATVISGMRNSSAILIYVNVQKALDAGLKFYMSSNGVVLTEGDKDGYLRPQFFEQVVTSDGQPVPDWHPDTKFSVVDPILEPAPTPTVSVDPVDEAQKKPEGLTIKHSRK